MVRMIPNFISDSVKSNAEKKLFKMFSETATTGNICILHSLGLADHLNNVFGEVDYVVLCQQGVLCIEVKGGEVSRTGGVWSFTNRYGKTDTKPEGPFEQAQGNMHSLRNVIKKYFGGDSKYASVQFACCVIMPDCSFDYKGPDIIPEILFDNSFEWDLEKIINHSFRYWRGICETQHHFTGSQLSSKGVDNLAGALRADFRFCPSLRQIFDQTNEQLNILTEEQYDVLDEQADNDRLLVSGVAGTGKTLLALEQCRRGYYTGRKMLYLCYNNNIERYVQSVIKKENMDLDAFTLHALMMKCCGDEPSDSLPKDYFDQLIPRFLQTELSEVYDCIVVDEGQDLLRSDYMDCLDKLVLGGLREGKWAIYYDPNQNVYNRECDITKAIQFLKPLAACRSLTLNCRNAEEIGKVNIALTGIDQARRFRSQGGVVEWLEYSSREEERAKLFALLDELKADCVENKDIVLLSPWSVADTRNCLYGYEKLPNGKLKVKNIWFAGSKDYRLSSINTFKGLEADVIIMLDVDSYYDEKRRLQNYVAASRASAALYIFYDSSSNAERTKMLLENINK